MTGIVGQADQYAAFDNTPRPERVAHEVPQEIIAEFTRGRSVGTGMLNPAGIKRQHFAGWENDYGRPGPLEPPEAFHDQDSESALTGLSPDELEYRDFGHDPHRHVPESEVYGSGSYGPDGHYDDYDHGPGYQG